MSAGIGVIGCGAAARRIHLPAFRAAGARVVAFASASRASAEAAAADWGGGAVVDDWRKLLALDEVEAVTICTPNHLHAEIAIAAARAGRHILVEKPIATTLAEADEMLAAADAAGVVLMVAHNARSAPPVVAAREAVTTGLLGEVRGVRAVLRNQGPAAWAPGATWFTDPARAGGGALIDLGVHLADAMRAILGREPLEMTAMCRPAPPVDVDAHMLLRFDGDVIAALHVGWDAAEPNFELTIVGSAATFHADTRVTTLTRPDCEPEPFSTGPADDPCAAFLRAAAGERPFEPSGADGRAALAVVTAAYAAIAGGEITDVGRG